MRSIFGLLARFKKDEPTVIANNGGVALGGDNAGVIIVNDKSEIKNALKEVLVSQAEARSLGVAGDLQSEIGRQIDHYRDKMNEGRVREALGLYTELITHQAKNLNAHSIFRIKANIAICKHLLGEAVYASVLLFEACTYAPENDKAIAFKAFAYIIAGKAKEAISYGLAELKNHPHNDELAGFIIQAARIEGQYHDGFNDLYETLPDDVKLSKSVRLAHIHFLSSKDVEGWMTLAEKYLAEHPDDLLAKSLVAQGVIQLYVNSRQGPNGFKFASEDIEKLKVAAKYFEEYWAEFRNSDRLANGWDLQVVQSLVVSYKLVGDFESLRTLCAYVISELAADQSLVDATAKILLDLDDPDLCLKAIDKLENLDDAGRLRFLLMLAQKDWAALSRFQDYSLAKFDGEFLIQAKVVVYIARAKKGDSRGKASLERLLQSEKLDSRARLLLFDFSNACGLISIAELARLYGSEIVSENSDVIEFFHYIKLIRTLMQWREIVLRLSSFPDALDNYELKHTLALAYLNEHPLRVEALVFFEEVAKNPEGFYLLLGLFYFKRARYDEIPSLISQYYDSGGRDLYGLIALIDIAKIRDDQEALGSLFSKYDQERYDGTPEQWMHVARGLVEAGNSKKGLDLGYTIYSQNPNVAKVVLGYFHLFLSANKNALLDKEMAVGAGCSIKLVSSDDRVVKREVSEFIEDEIILSPGAVDSYVRKVIGKCVGYEYTQERLQGSVVWRLEEVKHKYLEAFHKICATYESQFPEDGGLWSFKVEEGDIQSLLDFIKRQAEKDEDFIATVTDKHIPLGIAAGMWKKNVFQVSDLLRFTNGRIDTCLGTADERKSALDVIARHKNKIIVLDAYTAWVAAELDLLVVFGKYFERLIVSQESLSSMRQLVGGRGELGRRQFNVGWSKGRFVSAEFTEADIKAQSEGFLENISKIEGCCSVVHYNFSSGLDELTETLLDISPEAVAPYFLAKEHSALFVSDDGYSREFAKHSYGVADSTWLQAIVNELMREQVISPFHYVNAIVGLCRFKHASVSISSYVIESVFERDHTKGLDEFKLISGYVGGPHAEVNSHFGLVMRFIVRHWVFEYNPSYDPFLEKMLALSHGDAFPSAKVKMATSIMLERVLQMPDGVRLLNDMTEYPILRLREFIFEWWEGHFY